jgi:hypothetical protein
VKTFYQVRFVCYQYNCGGGSLQNGRYDFKKNFDKIEDARAFAAQVKKLSNRMGTVPEGSNEFARDYVHDGFVDYLIGVFKITEEPVNG